jgi:putative ABC transport system permease protein
MGSGRPARTMARLSLRGLRAHAGRLVLTLLAVVVGTMFVGGTLVLTGTLDRTFDRVISSEYEGVDVVVRPGEGQPNIPPDVADRISGDPTVGAVNIHDDRGVVLTDGKGGTVDTGGLQVHPRAWYPADRIVGQPMTIGQGHEPGPGEVALSSAASQDTGLKVGDTLTVNDSRGELPLTVSGTYDGDGGGQIDLAMNEADFTDRYAADGLPGLAVASAAGSDAADTVAALRSDLGVGQEATPDTPAPPRVDTGADLVEQNSESVDSALGFVRYFLVAFALIALLVAMFIIANTFAVTVAQRMREFALLRALGASGRQVVGVVLAEAVGVGLLGSALGVAAGAGVVAVILDVLRRADLGLPSVSVELSVTSVVVPLVVGTVVTVLSAWGPARRAGRVPPVAAMRGTSSPAAAPLTVRTLVGAVIAVAGIVAGWVAVVSDGWGTGARAQLCAVGTVGLLVGVFLVSPAVSAVVVPVIGRVIGAPFRSAGRLAATNSRRTPRRTASTAFALTLGLALVTVTGMLGASMTASVKDVVDSEVTADYVVAPPGGAVDVAVPGKASTAVTQAPGVGSSYTVGKAVAAIGDAGTPLVTVSNGDPSTVFDVGETTGTLDLGDGEGLTMKSSYAADHGWQVGDMVPVGVPGMARVVDMPLRGTYGGSQLLGDVVVASDAFWNLAPGNQGMGGNRILAVAVSGDGSMDSAALQDSLEDAVAQFPAVTVQTPQEYAGGQTVLVDRLVAVVYALLALAVAVAVLGVVNTLALSVVERRRELGMLRAVGAGRGLIRRMVVLESVQTSLYGALGGVLVGLAAGWAFLSVLGGVGLHTIAVPWGQVVGVLVGSAVVGVVAAVLPAARAARIPLLEAVAD